jgi:hydrogenase nickel incorporation protein HypA/HybF
MHELGLARSIVDTIVGSAEMSGAKQVKRVYMSIGCARDVVPDLMEIAFEHLTRGTIAEGAELVITRVPVAGRCKECGMVFPIDLFDNSTWKCPMCGSNDYELFRGREFDIDRIEVVREVEEKADVA